jgi:hypothetical protein
MGPQSVESIGKVYVGVFGGGGAIVSTSLSQQGSAFKS